MLQSRKLRGMAASPENRELGSKTVKQTIVETIEAPRLSGIETTDFVTFREKRANYERLLTEKNSDVISIFL